MSGSLSTSIEGLFITEGAAKEEESSDELTNEASPAIKQTQICFRSEMSCDFGLTPRRPILKTGGSCTASSSSSESKEVSFDTVHVRNYFMTAGDHPECSYGCPVQLDWDYVEQLDTNIDDFEKSRGPRRKLGDLVLSYYRRKALLERSGVSKEEQCKVERRIRTLKRQRSQTKMLLPTSKLEEFFASASRKMRRRSGLGGNKKGVCLAPATA